MGIEKARGECPCWWQKVNQIGSLTETRKRSRMAHRRRHEPNVCPTVRRDTRTPHRADSRRGHDCGQIKRALSRGPTGCRNYNQLIRIEEGLGASAIYAALVLKKAERAHEKKGPRRCRPLPRIAVRVRLQNQFSPTSGRRSVRPGSCRDIAVGVGVHRYPSSLIVERHQHMAVPDIEEPAGLDDDAESSDRPGTSPQSVSCRSARAPSRWPRSCPSPASRRPSTSTVRRRRGDSLTRMRFAISLHAIRPDSYRPSARPSSCPTSSPSASIVWDSATRRSRKTKARGRERVRGCEVQRMSLCHTPLRCCFVPPLRRAGGCSALPPH